MKSLFSGSAIAAAALLSTLFVLAASPSVAETSVSQSHRNKQTSNTQDNVTESSPSDLAGKTAPETVVGKAEQTKVADAVPVLPPASYVATAYSLRGRTASGKPVSHGIIAADPKFLPLGSRVHVLAGPWTGEYLVADTGGAIKGRKIDIWTPNSREAMRFGRRNVKLTVLSYGKRAAAKRRI
jgi:3D (Asp-Asp-Asp) domain-containing protein